MSKKIQTYGPANDEGVPEEELLLAALIQNAGSRGLRSCRGGYFKRGNKQLINEKGATTCCALGAARIAYHGFLVPMGIPEGNDGSTVDGHSWMNPEAREKMLTGYTVGAAFYQAMRR